MRLKFHVDLPVSIQLGKDCPIPPFAFVDIDPAELSQPDRDALAKCVCDDGKVHPLTIEGTQFTHLIVANGCDLSDLLDAVRETVDKFHQHKNKKQREAEESLAAFMRLSDDECIKPNGSKRCPKRGVSATNYVAHVPADVPRNVTTIAKQQRLEQLAKERNEAALEEALANHRAQIQRDHDWIAANGSNSLRRMVSEGMDYNELLAEEREKHEQYLFEQAMNRERSMWELLPEECEVHPVEKPTGNDWALLDAARVADPECSLGMLVQWDEHGKQTSEVVVVGEFHGEAIYFRSVA